MNQLYYGDNLAVLRDQLAPFGRSTNHAARETVRE
jgi:hypothetical protein